MRLKLESKLVRYKHWGQVQERTRITVSIDDVRVGTLVVSRAEHLELYDILRTAYYDPSTTLELL